MNVGLSYFVIHTVLCFSQCQMKMRKKMKANDGEVLQRLRYHYRPYCNTKNAAINLTEQNIKRYVCFSIYDILMYISQINEAIQFPGMFVLF